MQVASDPSKTRGGGYIPPSRDFRYCPHTAASIVGNLERLLAPTLENLWDRFGVFGKIANLVNLLKRGVRAQTRVPTRVEWLDADKTGLYTADK